MPMPIPAEISPGYMTADPPETVISDNPIPIRPYPSSSTVMWSSLAILLARNMDDNAKHSVATETDKPLCVADAWFFSSK